jgi:hypothetical protein
MGNKKYTETHPAGFTQIWLKDCLNVDVHPKDVTAWIVVKDEWTANEKGQVRIIHKANVVETKKSPAKLMTRL